jgi:lysophospholipase L1-like esterase
MGRVLLAFGRRPVFTALVFTITAILSGCGGSSPVAPAPPALAITCPTTVAGDSADGNPVVVPFDTPRTINGTAPITTTCSVPSGQPFNVGTTAVSCEAKDSRGQAASCSFSVTVRPPPQLRFSSYVTFGDSLTEGVISLSPTILALDRPGSYPSVLRNLLRVRYPTQSMTIFNAGNAGELASGEGIRRFRGTLIANQPEVVLLMEGTNDLLFQQHGVEPALQALESMINDAESLNVRVCLATIPPQRPFSSPDRTAVAGLIPGFNDQVRALAARRNAVLIDVFAAMKDDLSLIGQDNLHPTARGYEVMAGVFEEGLTRAFGPQSTPAAYGVGAGAAASSSRTMRENGAKR